MKLRYVTALLASILAFIVTLMAGWVFTEMEIIKLMLLALLIYFGTYLLVLMLTEPQPKKGRTRWDLYLYDLKEE